ncbi:MAG: hypothetical protein FWG40_12855 [Peptococcaceae bacterium]|nr:hypothetical protein [Peptococcaceae bacterium]
MSNIISGKALLELITRGEVVVDGNPANCDPIKYDFVLDSNFLKAQYGGPIQYDALQPIEQKDAVIAPGEAVFVLTKETLRLPNNMFLQLSPKREMTEYGIMTLGGFAVDPGYHGKLMFGLYNFSSRAFRLLPGKKLVAAVFSELVDGEIANIGEVIPPKSIHNFPPRLIEMIQECAPIGLSSLEDAVSTIKRQIELMEKGLVKNEESISQIHSLIRKTREDMDENTRLIGSIGRKIDDLVSGLDNESKLRKELEFNYERQFSDLISAQKESGLSLERQLSDLASTLKDEMQLRKESDFALEEKISATQKEADNKLTFFKGVLWLSTALGGIIVALLISYLAGWLQF